MPTIADDTLSPWFRNRGPLVTTITILALAVRVAGNRFGLPHEYHPDENMLIKVASAMAAGADWNPHFFHWGGAHFYVTALVFRAASAPGYLASGRTRTS